MSTGVVYTTIEGEMLDRICWAHYGRIQGIIEAVYAENAHIENQDMILDTGLEIFLPVLETETNIEAVNLWE